MLSLIMSMTLLFFIEFCIGLIAFYTINAYGMHFMKEAILSFFSGAVIPIVFFPDWLKTITYLLPFKDIVYTPVSIYLGLIAGEELSQALFSQMIWVFILLMITMVFFRVSIKKVTVQGG